MEKIDPDKLYKVREVSKMLRVDDTTVRRWIKGGLLEAVTLPHASKRQGYRVRGATILTLMEPEVVTA